MVNQPLSLSLLKVRPKFEDKKCFVLFNRNERLVKSLTRTSVVHDKESEARETLPSSRNSYTEHSRERQRRKVKGEAQNIDVENRWRELSKVSQYDSTDHGMMINIFVI